MKRLEQIIHRYFKEIRELENGEAGKLPGNAFFMRDGQVLCLERRDGVSRFPYGKDGFTVWVYSSGYVSVNESTFYVFLGSEEGKEPYLAFYAGEKRKDGTYDRVSLMGGGKSSDENDVKRYCIYDKDAAYFLTESGKSRYAVRIFATDDKKVCITLMALSSKRARTFYLSSYMNALFKYANAECFETKWFKKCTYEKDRFFFESPEDIDRKTHIENFGIVQRTVSPLPIETMNTTSRGDYAGGKENSISASSALREGRFSEQKKVTHFTDTAIAGDIVHFSLSGKESARIDYVIGFSHDASDVRAWKEAGVSLDTDEYLEKLHERTLKNNKRKSMLKFYFRGWKDGKMEDETLNRFLEYVIYQTEYCGLAKNSGALFLGVRDVMQQIQAALIWNPRDCRKKILEVLDFIDPSGNPPRQYSIPPEGADPRMDLRPFIDQGVWIISAIYTYLSYTDDESLLDEIVGYYERRDGYAVRSEITDTVFDHMVRIMGYLCDHIDPDTGCLRAMYGDWNDALDGLGVSRKGQDYGNGVSVMASCQFYQNLREMTEMIEKTGKRKDLLPVYRACRERLIEGLKTYAIVGENGKRKILHGWGEDRAYAVGGFDDVDHQSRDSLTANAFYVLSGLYVFDFLSREELIGAFSRLDSKYGLRTFQPHFEPDVEGVGRIVHLPKGTAENGATYIHASLFGILALFMIDEPEMAFRQLEKILPITHRNLSTSPFVMPNSYSYCPEEGMDGESMSDWYTGSANTLIKTLIQGVFGIRPDLNGLTIAPSRTIFSEEAKCALIVHSCPVEICFCGHEKRIETIEINGEKMPYRGAVYIAKERLKSGRLTVRLY